MKLFSEEHLKRIFSSNMRQLMAQKSISENELKKVTGISQSAINRIKNGQVCPSLYQAFVISEALNCSVEHLTNNSFKNSLVKEQDYVPVITSNSLPGNDEATVIGFVENDGDRKLEGLGFKVDKSFNCKILNNNSIVIASLNDIDHLNNGDTILFYHYKQYMIGTMQNRYLKPIDNLSISINAGDVTMIGKVVSIETKYIKDTKAVSAILNKFNFNISETLSKIKTSLNPHLA